MLRRLYFLCADHRLSFALLSLCRWAEVSLLLRKPILQEEDMLYTVAAAEAGLIYTDEVRANHAALHGRIASVQTCVCLLQNVRRWVAHPPVL